MITGSPTLAGFFKVAFVTVVVGVVLLLEIVDVIELEPEDDEVTLLELDVLDLGFEEAVVVTCVVPVLVEGAEVAKLDVLLVGVPVLLVPTHPLPTTTKTKIATIAILSVFRLIKLYPSTYLLL